MDDCHECGYPIHIEIGTCTNCHNEVFTPPYKWNGQKPYWFGGDPDISAAEPIADVARDPLAFFNSSIDIWEKDSDFDIIAGIKEDIEKNKKLAPIKDYIYPIIDRPNMPTKLIKWIVAELTKDNSLIEGWDFKEAINEILERYPESPDILDKVDINKDSIINWLDKYYEDYSGGGQKVYDFGNGWSVLQLITNAQLKYESANMRDEDGNPHCLGSETYGHPQAIEDGEESAYSIRDPENRPHVTILVDPGKKTSIEVRGPGNQDPPEDMMELVRQFYAHMDDEQEWHLLVYPDIKDIDGKVIYKSVGEGSINPGATQLTMVDGGILEQAISEGISLKRAYLYAANLSGANLRGANLRGADLGGADLIEANLRGADLRGADLYGANLYGASLIEADLYGANLYGANLYGANLGGADLRGADLYGARYSESTQGLNDEQKAVMILCDKMGNPIQQAPQPEIVEQPIQPVEQPPIQPEIQELPLGEEQPRMARIWEKDADYGMTEFSPSDPGSPTDNLKQNLDPMYNGLSYGADDAPGLLRRVRDQLYDKTRRVRRRYKKPLFHDDASHAILLRDNNVNVYASKEEVPAIYDILPGPIPWAEIPQNDDKLVIDDVVDYGMVPEDTQWKICAVPLKLLPDIHFEDYDDETGSRDREYVEDLAAAIKSGEVDMPLMCFLDKSGGVILVDGYHRTAALNELGYEYAKAYMPYEDKKFKKIESNVKITARDPIQQIANDNGWTLEGLTANSHRKYILTDLNGIVHTVIVGDNRHMGDPRALKNATADLLRCTNGRCSHVLQQQNRNVNNLAGPVANIKISEVKPVIIKGIHDDAKKVLHKFWEDHPDLRKGCLDKYGYDPIDDELPYWYYGLAEPEHHMILEDVLKNDGFIDLEQANRWTKSELAAEKKEARIKKKKCKCGSTKYVLIDKDKICKHCLSPWRYAEKEPGWGGSAMQNQQYRMNTVGNIFEDNIFEDILREKQPEIWEYIQLKKQKDLQQSQLGEQKEYYTLCPLCGVEDGGVMEDRGPSSTCNACGYDVITKESNNVADNDSPSRYIHIDHVDLGSSLKAEKLYQDTHESCKTCKINKAGLTGYCPACNKERKYVTAHIWEKEADITQNDISDSLTNTTDLHAFTDDTLADLRSRNKEHIKDIESFSDEDGNVYFVYSDGKIHWGKSIDNIISQHLNHKHDTYTHPVLVGSFNLETKKVKFESKTELNQTASLKKSFLSALKRNFNTYFPDIYYPNEDILHSDEEIYDVKMGSTKKDNTEYDFDEEKDSESFKSWLEYLKSDDKDSFEWKLNKWVKKKSS